ncbi:MAG: hypothetical protein KBF06_03355 [Bacteroidales bacterium]|jgi:hypothetical protein|nr:hypothetical protein [Bacteroidales bacterium]MBP9511506.1 hypothetical protein [Bacteroidales bacterium]MBP9588234.1 hypothetical protein [Bacteroidales bacterium]HOU35436.1 hypothetical protein [Bacteroidales bacterium]
MIKRNILKYVIILGIIFIIVFSCKKEDNDYRDTYIGDWVFIVDRTEFNTDSIGYYYHDSVHYEGKIVYGELDNEIMIKYTTENTITLTIGENGELSDFPTHYCSGKFLSRDTLHLYLRWGGLGGGTIHQIEGLKK